MCRTYLELSLRASFHHEVFAQFCPPIERVLFLFILPHFAFQKTHLLIREAGMQAPRLGPEPRAGFGEAFPHCSVLKAALFLMKLCPESAAKSKSLKFQKRIKATSRGRGEHGSLPMLAALQIQVPDPTQWGTINSPAQGSLVLCF